MSRCQFLQTGGGRRQCLRPCARTPRTVQHGNDVAGEGHFPGGMHCGRRAAGGRAARGLPCWLPDIQWRDGVLSGRMGRHPISILQGLQFWGSVLHAKDMYTIDCEAAAACLQMCRRRKAGYEVFM